MSSRHSRNRARYPVFIELGLVASLLIVIGAFRANYTADDTVEFVAPPVDVVPLVPVPPTDLTPKPPPPPVPQVPVVVPDDEALDDEVIPIDQNIDVKDPVPDFGPPPKSGDDDDAIENIWGIERIPEPEGGMEGILRRLEYPSIAQKAGIEGLVTITFIVEKDGTVSNAEILKGIGGGCDEAALKVLRATRFTPGVQNGRLVRVKMNFPVRFRITG